MTAFAVFAALLAGFGMYSLMSYLAAQRAEEMGIRIALGATSARILWLFLRQGLTFAVLGIAAGAGLVAAGYRLIASKLYMTGVFDAFALGCSVGLVLLIAVMASWVPARRAIRVDVIAALREN
jgi:putative ABC transport system permease protein